MKLFQLRAPRALILSGLAVLAGAVATADSANAQRKSWGDETRVTSSHQAPRASASISIGTRGASVNASFGQRARIPRGFSGGRYETRYERVWVPGYSEQVWEPAIYEWRYDACGRRVRVCVRSGYYRTVCVPGRYESRAYQVWVPARRVHVGTSRRGYDRGRQPVRQHRVTHVGRRR